MGYAIIEIPASKKPRILEIGTIKLHKYAEHARRLQVIHERLTTLIDTHKPGVMAIEAPFFGKNPQSMLKLGRAQGVAMAAAMGRDLEVYEFAPRKIKQSVVGNGNASKEQMAALLTKEFQLDAGRYLLDATDALATALCYFYQSRSPLGVQTGKKGGWDSFLKANPGRVK